MLLRSHLPTLNTALQTLPPWTLFHILQGAKAAPAHLQGRCTVIAPTASDLYGTLKCFHQRGTPSWSSPPTWSWLAPRQLFQQGPQLMTAPAPPLESGTRTTSCRPSPFLLSSLDVQGPALPSLTPPPMKNTTTSERPSPGSALCAPSCQTPALPNPSAPCPTPPPSSPIIPLGADSPPLETGKETPHLLWLSLHPSTEPPSTALLQPKQQPHGTGTTPER